MAHVELNDFAPKFEDDFYDDLPFIRDKANDAIRDLARKYRGQFDELDRNFGSYRSGFMQVLEKIVDIAWFDRNERMDDIMKDAAIAAAVVVAMSIGSNRFGSNGADDFIEDELDGNPYLEGVQRNGGRDRGRRGIERRSLSGRGGNERRDRGRGRDRGSDRGSDRGRDRGRDRNDRDRNNNDDDNRSVGRSSLARNARKQRQEEENQQRNERSEERKVIPTVPTPTLAIGSVITAENYVARDNQLLAPVYLIGTEQVILTDNGYEIADYAGTNEVDYEKHRIDRFYPDILGGKTLAADIAAAALREATAVKDTVINGFIKNPDVEGDMITDPKLFAYLKSATYTTPLTQYGLTYDPIEIRNSLIDEHNGDFSWFGKNALAVDINHKVCVVDCSNDGLQRLQAIWDCKQMHVLVHQLVEISAYIDIAAWKYLHDVLTHRFNTRLLRNGVMVALSSITADWNDFKELVATQYPHLAEIQNNTSGIFDGIVLDIETPVPETPEQPVERGVNIAISRKTIYLPVSSFDLDIGTPSINDGYGVIVANSVMFNVVKNHFTDTVPGAFIYLATMDGMVLEVCDASTMLSPQQYVMRRYN